MEDLTAKERAKKMIYDFEEIVGLNGSLSFIEAKKCALYACEVILNDCRMNFEVSKELHPHAEGLTAGTMMCWLEVKKEIEKYNGN